MYSLELSRAIAADREREVERAIRQRRLLEILAIREIEQAEDGRRSGGTTQGASPCAPVLEQAR